MLANCVAMSAVRLSMTFPFFSGMVAWQKRPEGMMRSAEQGGLKWSSWCLESYVSGFWSVS